MSVEYKASMLQIAEKMIAKKISYFEGIVALSRLRAEFEVDNMDHITQEICAIDSEIDNIPLGKIREHCSKEFLEKIDKTELLYENDILKICKTIIEEYKN